MVAWNKKYPEFRTCEVCWNEFKNKTWHIRRFCSHECYYEAQRKWLEVSSSRYKTWKNNPNWLWWITNSGYSVDWTMTLKRSIRERDKYTCQICWEQQWDKCHAVHHIDYNKHNCDPINLITLCNSCHMKTNTNRENRIIFFSDRASITPYI